MVGTSLRILIGTELGQPESLIGDDQIYNVDKMVNKLHAFDGRAGVPQLSINELYREPAESNTLSHTPILQDILLFPSQLRSCLPFLLFGLRLEV